MRSLLIGLSALTFGLAAATADASPGLHCILNEQPGNQAICDTGSMYNFSPGGGAVCNIFGSENALQPVGGSLQSWGFQSNCYGSSVSYTDAVCCNGGAIGINWQNFTTSSVTVSCGAGQIAVGGGAYCNDSTAKLKNSLPLPYTSGSTPTQWTAQCNKGAITVYANCTYGPPGYDADAVVIRQVEPSKSGAQAFCPSGRIALSSGFWCGSGYGTQSHLTPNLTSAVSSCSTTDTHAFAVCASGLYY